MKIQDLEKKYDLVSAGSLESEESLIQYIGMDCGSTATRALRFSLTDVNSSELHTLSAEYGTVNTDLSYLKTSNTLYDNLEFIINDVTSGKQNPRFLNAHIIKGGLQKKLNISDERMTGSQTKAGADITYVNIITNCVLKALIKMSDSMTRYSKVLADLTVALRTEDTKSTSRVAAFKEELAGMYTVEMPRIKDLSGQPFKVLICFSGDAIYVEDEATAATRYWCTINHKSLNNYKRVIGIDGGGSTFGYSYLEDGELIKSGSRTDVFGGTQLEQDIAEQIDAELGCGEPSLLEIREALATAQRQDGNGFTPIVDQIKECKKTFAKRVISGLSNLLARNTLKTTQINLIVCSGGCFSESIDPQTKEVVVPSLKEYIEKIWKKTSPNTEFSVIQEKNPIVYGLQFYRLYLESMK